MVSGSNRVQPRSSSVPAVPQRPPPTVTGASSSSAGPKVSYKVPPVVPPRPNRPGAPEVTVGQGAASSASQLPQFGSLQTAPDPRPPQYKAPPVLPTQGNLRVLPIGFLWRRLSLGISITGPGWRITPGNTLVGRSNKRAAEQGRSHRQSHLVLHASTRGLLQAPWQTVSQLSGA